MYLTTTRTEILYAVILFSRLMHCAIDLNLIDTKRVVKYIKGTINYSVTFHKSQSFRLTELSDIDWVG